MITEFTLARRGVHLLQELEPWMLVMIDYLQKQKVRDDVPKELKQWVWKHGNDFLLHDGLLFKFDPVSD